jgi:hypothetical protein
MGISKIRFVGPAASPCLRSTLTPAIRAFACAKRIISPEISTPRDAVAMFGNQEREASHSTSEIRNPYRLLWDQRHQERLPGGAHLRLSKAGIGLVIEGARVAIPQLFNI